MQGSTIAAIATAPGAGGIAVVRLSGAQSYAVAERVFRPANPGKKVAQAKGYTALFGHFVDGGEKFFTFNGSEYRGEYGLTASQEDYLEMICRNCPQSGSVRLGVLARKINVSESSASKMVHKLSETGLVTFEKY